MKASRITAVALVFGAVAWIASGYFVPHESGESRAAVRSDEPKTEKLFRVAVLDTERVPHSRKFTLSGRTEAERKVTIVARTNGVLTELKVKRGDHVKKGDVIAILSNEARDARVAQAQALLIQRRTELVAKRKLIEKGTLPRLDLANLEAQFKAAEALMAAAEVERDHGVVRAPWDGIITEIPTEIGGASFSAAGKEIARLVALDPMLAVVEVAERKLSGIKLGDPADVRLVTGQTASGKIRYVSPSATPATRTYRVEVELKNADGKIPDGITSEVTIKLAPVPATRVPRSALTFSSGGDLGVRTVGAGGVVAFVPVAIVEDDQAFMWLSGIPDTARVIVQGQDFVREGQKVEAVAVNTARTATK